MAFYKWQLEHQWRYFRGINFILVYTRMLYLERRNKNKTEAVSETPASVSIRIPLSFVKSMDLYHSIIKSMEMCAPCQRKYF